MTLKDSASYVFLAIVWGLSFLFMLRGVEAFGWAGVVTFRCFVAAATLIIVAFLTGRRLRVGAGWRAFAVVGATTVAGQLIGLCFAMPLIGTAMSAILVATIPLFSMLIARLWGIEHLTRRHHVGLVLGFSGMIVLVGFPAVPFTPSFALGCATTLLACLCAAYGSCYASYRLKGVSAWDTTTGAFLAGGVITLPLLIVVPVPGTPQPIDYLYLFVLGAIMSATTYVLYFRLVATIGATRAISVEFAVTVVAVLVGALFLHEPLSAMQIAGAVTIIAGCALVIGLFPSFARSTR
ncbi:DMT family transporter [Undibacter mobilis]|uniref:DMT family transporter n=1 Tax=Undibacter mobilis TaxID=2292256 RepID=A0A371BBL1_9BRAD|nr:DMT family transporter [Undibacter mobilis]RDV04793.1 DMT family transporter [Undibacter mobilis]